MNGINNQPLLSICIPTWNRSKYLEQSLIRLYEQMGDINPDELEIYVSDNCSEDDTPMVVEKYISKGLPITYNRNETNLGAARNFIKCMQWASGKYIYLLGDDDILKHGSLKYILDLIRGNDYGLIHINHRIRIGAEKKVFDNLEDYFKLISYWITFMSGSIFRKEVVGVINPDKYVGTHLLQVPFYLKSASIGKSNLFVSKELMDSGLDSSSNGGYNFYEVFVKNYLNIWHELVDLKIITESCYEFLKKDIYQRFILNFNYTLLIRHKNVNDENTAYIGNRCGFKIKGAKELLKEYYGHYWYYRISWVYYIIFFCKSVVGKIKRIII